MRIRAKASYNLDILCFLNVMTADRYYVDFHREMYDKFYPLLSDGVKQKVSDMVEKQGYSMLSPTLTLFISALQDFNDRNLTEMFKSQFEIKSSMNTTPYSFSDENLAMYFAFFDEAIIPLIEELGEVGFPSFWEENRLPPINARCEHVNKYMEQFNLEKLISQYRDEEFDRSDFTIYLCSFAKPHGIKLCGNNIISDISYPDDTILSNVTHEAFHPPFDFETVKTAIDILAEKPWVKCAFENQNPNSGYHTIEGFIEEHVVEALGIYVLVQLGIEIDPFEYFNIHDEGSHVISPYFYRFLCEEKKGPMQLFEKYFVKFVDTLA